MIVRRALYLLAGISTASTTQYPGFDLVNQKQTQIKQFDLENPAVLCSVVNETNRSKHHCYTIVKLRKDSKGHIDTNNTIVLQDALPVSVKSIDGFATDKTKVVSVTQKGLVDLVTKAKDPAYTETDKPLFETPANMAGANKLYYLSDNKSLKTFTILDTSKSTDTEKLNDFIQKYTVKETKNGNKKTLEASNFINAMSVGLIGTSVIGSYPQTFANYNKSGSNIDKAVLDELSKLVVNLTGSNEAECHSKVLDYNKNLKSDDDKILMFSFQHGSSACIGYKKAGLNVAFSKDSDSSNSKNKNDSKKAMADDSKKDTDKKDTNSSSSSKARELFAHDVQEYIKTKPNSNKLGKNAYYGIISDYNEFVATTPSDDNTYNEGIKQRSLIVTAPVELDEPISIATYDPTASKLSTVKIVLIVICVVLVIVAIATAIWFVWSNKKST